MADDITQWLDGLGLGQYAQAFADNDIDARNLGLLSDDDLKELGLSLGHRRTFLAALKGEALDEASLAAPGAARNETAAPPEAERRQLTVMFCDLVGSTALSARLDPEDMRDVLRAYREACAEAIERFDGYIAKYLGDGLLVYFGYPQAHEDDPARATRAGLAILEAIAHLNTRLKQEKAISVAVRVGVHTGLVVAGEMGTGVTREELAIVGETPNIAARLEGLAEPNALVIGSLTHQLVQSQYVCDDLGRHTVKGISQPIQVYRVRAERLAESRFEAAHPGGRTPFVGREQEIALLLQRWEQSKEGEGQVVLLSGEAGIGKSRITEVLRERLAEEPHTRLHYQCSPYYANSALYPVIRQLERAARFTPDDTPEAKLDKLEALLTRSTEAVPEVALLFAALLSIPTGDRYPALDMTPQRQKEKTLAALADQLLCLAARQPILFILEDMHWIDPTTQEFLDLIVDQAQESRVLQVITFRPEWTAPWGWHTHVTPLTLKRLGRRQCATMVDKVTAGKALPKEIQDQIVTKTDGVPLFVEELTKTVVESGVLKEEADRYVLTGPLPPLAIPASLQDSLMARLDRLASVKEVAQTGAAIGREFAHELLAAVLPLSDNEFKDALGQLVKSELVFRRGTPPRASYIFKHALVQETAYGSLLKSKRHLLHQRIAQVLESQFETTAETQPELLAHHYTEAGLTEQAIPYWQRAGERAAERSANREAMAHLGKGLELLETLPDEPERAGRELTMQIALGGPLIATKGYAAPETVRAYHRAHELCERVGTVEQRFQVLYGLWVSRANRAEHQAALEIAEQFVGLAETQSDPAPVLVAYRSLGLSRLYRGEFAAARPAVEKALALYEPALHASLAFRYGQDPWSSTLGWLSWVLWHLGYPDQALRMVNQGLAHAREANHPHTLANTLGFGATMLHLFRRDLVAAEKDAKALIALAEEHGFTMWRGVGAVVQGWALVQRDATEEGISRILAGLAEERTGTQFFQPHRLALLAEARARQGEVDHGLRLLDEALEFGERTRGRWWKAEVVRLRGELLLRLTPPNEAEAEAALREAIEVAQQQASKSLELRAVMSLARLWQRQGREQDARALLAPVHDWFTEGFDTADLKEAKALLDELS